MRSGPPAAVPQKGVGMRKSYRTSRRMQRWRPRHWCSSAVNDSKADSGRNAPRGRVRTPSSRSLTAARLTKFLGGLGHGASFSDASNPLVRGTLRGWGATKRSRPSPRFPDRLAYFGHGRRVGTSWPCTTNLEKSKCTRRLRATASHDSPTSSRISPEAMSGQLGCGATHEGGKKAAKWLRERTREVHGRRTHRDHACVRRAQRARSLQSRTFCAGTSQGTLRARSQRVWPA